jgi:voltage-gated potassium channel
MSEPTVSAPSRLQRWETMAEWPLAGVAVVFLAAFSVHVLAQPGGLTARLLNWVMAALYVAFCVDYLARFILADQRTRWFFRNLPDLVIIALPFLRSLRVLRLVVLIEVMEKLFGDALRGRIVIYTVCSALLLIYSASLGVLDAERQLPQADIKSFGDAVWWSFTTITTVGYGDYHPMTVTGRVIAVLLMVGGVSLIGIITATVVTWIVQRVSDIDAAEQAATAGQIEQLRSEISHLKEMVSEIRDNGRGETASG